MQLFHIHIHTVDKSIWMLPVFSICIISNYYIFLSTFVFECQFTSDFDKKKESKQAERYEVNRSKSS